MGMGKAWTRPEDVGRRGQGAARSAGATNSNQLPPPPAAASAGCRAGADGTRAADQGHSGRRARMPLRRRHAFSLAPHWRTRLLVIMHQHVTLRGADWPFMSTLTPGPLPDVMSALPLTSGGEKVSPPWRRRRPVAGAAGRDALHVPARVVGARWGWRAEVSASSNMRLVGGYAFRCCSAHAQVPRAQPRPHMCRCTEASCTPRAALRRLGFRQ